MTEFFILDLLFCLEEIAEMGIFLDFELGDCEF
jgi:hypothetical protein